MKRCFFLIFALIPVLSFIGCDNTTSSSPSKTQFYYYEVFTVSKSNFNSVPMPSNNFGSIKNCRDKLWSYKITLLDSGSGVTHDVIFRFLINSGFTSQEARESISNLNSVGNVIYFGEYNQNQNIIFYFEQE